MSYIESNLVSGENVTYKTGLHWIVVVGRVTAGLIFAVAGIAVAIASRGQQQAQLIFGAGILLILIGAIFFINGMVRMKSVEMAVTNRRVVIKTGIVSRRSFEVMLSKIESIGIEEGLLGRILGFGTVIVRGTGGSPEPFRNVAHPLEFRKQVQQQIDLLQAPPDRVAPSRV